MFLNGRLPAGVLAPIAQGHLRKDAAAAWNAMNLESKKRYGVTIVPMGGMSSYRTYAQQVYLYRTSRPGWAARPGTSNHGWGLAVDLRTRQMRGIVDAIGAKYGYAKKWSDASWEWWHIKWRSGIWRGRVIATVGSKNFTIKKDQANTQRRRKAIRRLERNLRQAGYKVPLTEGHHYTRKLRAAVRRFQRKTGLHVDGKVGAKTWTRLLRHNKQRRG